MMAQASLTQSRGPLELAREAILAQIRRTQRGQLQALKLWQCLATARGSAVPVQRAGTPGLPPGSSNSTARRTDLSSNA
jgi:hypothetical protein